MKTTVIWSRWMDRSINGRVDQLNITGGRIDHGHHEGYAKRALEDTLAFEEAIKRAVDMTNGEDTLIIVTADHSHTMTIGTYPARGNNILGKKFLQMKPTFQAILTQSSWY